MSTPYVAYAAAAGQRDFDVPFPFINRSHVKVRVNGTLTTPLSWPTAARLRLPLEVPGGAVVEIERETPIEEQLVQFQDGNILTAEDLNKAVQQILYRQQEVSALYDRSLRAAQVRVGENLGIVTNPADVAQELAELVLEEDVLNEFRSRIAEIDLNAESILAQALDISRIDDAVDEAIGLVNTAQASAASSFASLDGAIGSVDGRLTTLRADHDGLVGIVDSLVGGEPGTGIATLIQEESNARIAGDTALAGTISLLGAKSGDSLSFVLDTSKVRVSPTESLAQRLNTISASNDSALAAVTAEQSARVDADGALATSLNLLDARVDGAEAAVLSESQARVSGDTALTTSLNALTARVGSAEATIVSDRQARVSADEAVASELFGLDARIDTAEATIVSDRQARVSGDAALASDLTALTARVGTNEATIVSDRQARVDGDNALASSLTALTSRVGTAESTIVSNQSAAASATAAVASDLSLLGARNGSGNAFVINTGTAQVGDGVTLASRFAALSAADGNNLAAIQSEEQARINADGVLTSSVNSLGSRMGSAESAIVNEQNARAVGDAAEAAARQALAARVTTAEGDINTVEAAVLTEQTARANGDNALSSSLTALTARVTSAEGDITTARADILSEQTARANGDSANATAINGLLTRMTAAEGDITIAEAAIVTEQNARVSGDNALASNISVLSTSLNGNIASVSTLQSSVNGLQARYGVSLDVNGYVTGFVQNNDGATGSFVVLADRFAIVTPGNSPQVPFEVAGGVVRIKEANIGSLNVEKLNSGALNATITQNGDWNVGTGRIVWDNGSHMKVAGVGFGSANQFIEWFGPKMAISLCSEANAITYLKTNGAAYFGGSLSAGVLKNAVRSTQVSATASVSTGTFGSNGGVRTVVVSFDSLRRADISSVCNGSGSPSVTIELRRNGVLLSTFNATGSTSCVAGFGEFEPGSWEETLSASWTFTDSSGGPNAEYTATVTSRPLSTAPSSTMGLIDHTQSLGVISTE